MMEHLDEPLILIVQLCCCDYKLQNYVAIDQRKQQLLSRTHQLNAFDYKNAQLASFHPINFSVRDTPPLSASLLPFRPCTRTI